jgi:hypothetical protein
MLFTFPSTINLQPASLLLCLSSSFFSSLQNLHSIIIPFHCPAFASYLAPWARSCLLEDLTVLSQPIRGSSVPTHCSHTCTPHNTWTLYFTTLAASFPLFSPHLTYSIIHPTLLTPLVNLKFITSTLLYSTPLSALSRPLRLALRLRETSLKLRTTLNNTSTQRVKYRKHAYDLGCRCWCQGMCPSSSLVSPISSFFIFLSTFVSFSIHSTCLFRVRRGKEWEKEEGPQGVLIGIQLVKIRLTDR